jgi:hypothetical protein
MRTGLGPGQRLSKPKDWTGPDFQTLITLTDDAWFAEMLINSRRPTFHLFGYEFVSRVLTIESKFLPKTLSSVISDVLYRLSNAARRFLESWVSDDITGGVDVGVETTVVVGVGADETEAWTTAGTETAESDWIG